MKMTLTLEFESASEHLMVSQALAGLFPGLAPTVSIVTKGNVGPGTAYPSAKLDVAPSLTAAVKEVATADREYPAGADALDKTFIDMGAPMTEGVPVEPRQLEADSSGKRKRRTKAEMEIARAAEAGNAPMPTEQTAAPAPVADAPARAVTIEELRTIGNKYVSKCGAPKFMELLRSYGDKIKNYGDIPEDKRADLVAKFEAVLASA